MTVAAMPAIDHRLPGAALSRWFLPVLLLVVPAVAAAQQPEERRDLDTPGLFIEAAAGWDGTVSRSVPVPVAFLIRNDADQMLEAELTLLNPWSGERISLGEIVVSSRTARRVTTIQTLDGWDECFAELRIGRQVLWRRELALTTGSEFDDVSNFALFIDDGGRRLVLPAPGDDSHLYRPELMVGGTAGRRVKCLTAKSWQVPNHPAPLSVIQTVIFPEKAPDDLLNDVQWAALARWMCQGGVVFVHAQSEAIITRLIQSAPLDADPVDASGPFAVRRVGLGSLNVYAQSLFDSEGAGLRESLAATLARLPKSPLEPILASTNYYYRGSARADLNRSIVILFFLGYALLIGVVSLVLFRLSQRKMAIYAGVVVAGASVLSGLIGGYLRFCRGDLHWTTVTRAGAGGLVQHGKIDVRSSGGRSTRVAMTGNDVDLQSIPNPRLWYGWNNGSVGHPPFTWQPDLLPNVKDTFQTSVAMTPWGRRELRATAFQPGVDLPDIEIRLLPAANATDGNGNPVDKSQVQVKLVNHLPFDLTNCTLVIGGTRPADNYQLALMQRQNSGWNNGITYRNQQGQTPVADANASIDVYSRHPLGNLAAGQTREDSYEAVFEVTRSDWNQMLHLRGIAVSPPKIAHLGASSAWLIGEIPKSPNLQVDPLHSDFDEEDDAMHLFLQEIRPEDLIDADGFLRFSPPAADNSAQPANN